MFQAFLSVSLLFLTKNKRKTLKTHQYIIKTDRQLYLTIKLAAFASGIAFTISCRKRERAAGGVVMGNVWIVSDIRFYSAVPPLETARSNHGTAVLKTLSLYVILFL